jgi:nuclear transport factor 2 (NTF2) superfamily protein
MATLLFIASSLFADGSRCGLLVAKGNGWEFDEHGLMRFRIASINDVPIKESERKYRWPLGRRPDDHPSLGDLGL